MSKTQDCINDLKRYGTSKYSMAKECSVSWQTIHNWDRGRGEAGEKHIDILNALLLVKKSSRIKHLDWINIKEPILKRDGYVCRRCGGTDGLTAHHIKPRDDGGTDDPKNLITLCCSCHDIIEEHPDEIQICFSKTFPRKPRPQKTKKHKLKKIKAIKYPKLYPTVPCACGCGKTFEQKWTTQRFYGNHRNKYYDQIYPRHKIGLRSTITIDGWTYELKNPRPATATNNN